MNKLKLDGETLKTWLWLPEKCSPEAKRPADADHGWYCPGVYMEPHPSDPALALFICPHCGRSEYTYPTHTPRGKRWRPGDRELM